MEFLQSFYFSSKYKARKTNVVTDSLSTKCIMLVMLEAEILGFEMIKDYYEEDDDFMELYELC